MIAAVHSRADASFLPNFCAIGAVFAVVVIAQLLAFILTLAALPDERAMDLLALNSLFVQWVALTSAAVLCGARRALARLAPVQAALVSYLALLLVTVVLSEAAWRLLAGGGILGLRSGIGHAGFLLRNLGISTIVSAVALRYFYVQYQWKRQVEAESQARIQALQARIRPHFFFNCMNTIASLTRSRPDLAEQAVEDLADLFRASLQDARLRVTLAEELDLCRRYLRIEGLRLGERLRTEWRVDDLPGDALIPALSLQPLVENAIYHGIEPLPRGGVISIRGRRTAEGLEVGVSNPLPPGDAPGRDGNRLAQDNVRQRLAVYHGTEGRLETRCGEAGYQVTLYLPYERQDHADPDR